MSPLTRFLRNSSFASKLFMGLGVAGIIVVANKMWISPYLRRQRYKHAEAWADMIIEQEENELNNK